MSRISTLLRCFAWTPALIVLALVSLATSQARAFDFDQVVEQAASRARQPFEEPERVPQWLLQLSYDQWRGIRFRKEKALWRDRGLPFEVQFFHPGLFYDRTVTVHEVDAEGVHPVAFSPGLFEYADKGLDSKVPQDLGFAGVRLHYPIKRPDYKDEVIVFLGATYFRAVGRDQNFGASARGVAIDTASRSGEEFPFFREFWLVRPARNATDIAVYALADSPSLTGAFKFVVDPGEQTTVAIEARVFRRNPIEKLGIAPLTSMFFHGENAHRWFDDFRPEVHDSDGLSIETAGGEWVWRPLDNPERLSVHTFSTKGVKGFGLLQRDREFASYEDLETRQDLRPSIWIVPRGGWDDGHIELVEIPTDADYNDNTVAYWVPKLPAELTAPLQYAYTMHWYGNDPTRPPGGRAVATRRGAGSEKSYERFVIDFEGKRLSQLAPDTVLRAVVSVASGDDTGRIVEQQVVKNTVTGGWRLMFQVEPAGDDPVELRAFLDLGGAAQTETWTYTLIP